MSTRLHISNTGNSLFLHYKLFKFSSRTQELLYFLNDNIFLTNSIQIQPEYLFSRFQNAFMCGKSTQSHIASNTKFLHFVPRTITQLISYQFLRFLIMRSVIYLIQVKKSPNLFLLLCIFFKWVLASLYPYLRKIGKTHFYRFPHKSTS